ncbi:MAG: ComE operon protein 1 [Anaerolineae bacterium]|nr:ComE operon protein 1 [Anaerolineae bacterium]
MPTWLDQHRGLVFGLLSAVTITGAGVFYLRQPAPPPIEIATVEPQPTATATTQPTPTATPGPVRVYITGAVANEDVYFMPPGSIIKDVVESAGGFTAEADHTRINLALEVQDQQQIHVPRRDETNPPPPIQGGPAPEKARANAIEPAPAGGVINLNTATIDELDTLPGIGPAIAKRIIEYRDTAGRFTSIEEITQVSGIGEATLAKIRPLITVE